MRWLAAAALLAAGPLCAQEIVSARYLSPTDIYGHGAVEGGEYARLEVRFADGSQQSVQYEEAVFEDTAPRLFDFNGDGRPEVVTVVSSFSGGARVQIFGGDGARVFPVAANAPIGQRNRWLAIAGIADLDRDGIAEIAFVDRPHLAKQLVVLSVDMSPEGAVELTERRLTNLSLSNHQYGSPIIEGGVRDCPGRDPVIVTTNGNWTQIVETRLAEGDLISKSVGTYKGPESFVPYLSCP